MDLGFWDALAVAVAFAVALGSAVRVGLAALAVELAEALETGSLSSGSSGVASMLSVPSGSWPARRRHLLDAPKHPHPLATTGRSRTWGRF